MENLMFVLELIGAVAFAISGAMAAIKNRADIFGVIFLAVMTALGGGVIRDVLLGNLPPKMFVSYAYFIVSVVAAIAVFADAYIRSEKYILHRDRLDAVNNIFDAIGLAVFTISGMNTSMAVSDNVLLILILGMATGVGGGMLRDVMSREKPMIFCKNIYATATLIGTVFYYFASYIIKLPDVPSMLAAYIIIVTVRMLAAKFRWDLPTIEKPEPPTQQ